jgi:multiple sugar transport system permease protein
VAENAATSTRPAPRRGGLSRWHGGATPWFFLAPFLAAFALFRLGPVIGGFFISLTRWSIVGSPTWVGLANYRALLRDPLFHTSLVNTLFFVLLTVPAMVALSLGLALLVNMRLAPRIFARTSIFLPYVVMAAVVGVIWNWMLDSNFGLVNYGLKLVGLGPFRWLTDFKLAMPAVAGVTIWWTVGFNMIIYLAGLQDVPRELEEAAMIDGAGALNVLRHVTLPMLTPTTFVVLMLTTINAAQVFDQIYVMTGGGPGTSTLTLVQYLFYQAFQSFNLGYGSAVAYFVFLLLAVFGIIQLRLVHQQVTS